VRQYPLTSEYLQLRKTKTLSEVKQTLTKKQTNVKVPPVGQMNDITDKTVGYYAQSARTNKTG